MVQIIFLFRSFEISKDIQSVQNTIYFPLIYFIASKGSNLYILFHKRELKNKDLLKGLVLKLFFFSLYHHVSCILVFLHSCI